jgi:hypothetical protein
MLADCMELLLPYVFKFALTNEWYWNMTPVNDRMAAKKLDLSFNIDPVSTDCSLLMVFIR